MTRRPVRPVVRPVRSPKRNNQNPTPGSGCDHRLGLIKAKGRDFIQDLSGRDCLALIWGASFYFIEIGLIYLDPFWLVSLRLTSGAAALFLWLTINRMALPRDRRFWGATLIMGCLNNVIPFTLIAFGQQYVTGGLASIINANTAFISSIISGIFIASEPVKRNRVVGVLIGICGVAIAIGGNNPATSAADNAGLTGELAIVLATVSYALAAAWGKLKLTRYTPLQGRPACCYVLRPCR
jgi:drug/metabolite transporter (DMT)-like permease